jgi:hypothetical protein
VSFLSEAEKGPGYFHFATIRLLAGYSLLAIHQYIRYLFAVIAIRVVKQSILSIFE